MYDKIHYKLKKKKKDTTLCTFRVYDELIRYMNVSLCGDHHSVS